MQSSSNNNNNSGTSSSSSSSSRHKRFVHADQSLSPSNGVTYGVRYIGNVPVLASTRSLRSEVRNQVTRLAIGMCCEAAGLMMPGRRRRDKAVARHLGEQPVMQFSGWSANITITTQAISVVAMETKDTITSHNLINVSFASGGDADTMDFVAYVAKDSLLGRACHVIECPGGLASDVVSTIGQAFELRYKGAFANTEPQAENAAAAAHSSSSSSSSSQVQAPTQEPWYHAEISRQACEQLLAANGSFLVRASSSKAGQYVLSCRVSDSLVKHLLLVDPQGCVRTRDRRFDSLQQLIAFHSDSQLPIVSDDCEMLLLHPVSHN